MIGTAKAGTLKPSNHGNLELDPGNYKRANELEMRNVGIMEPCCEAVSHRFTRTTQGA